MNTIILGKIKIDGWDGCGFLRTALFECTFTPRFFLNNFAGGCDVNGGDDRPRTTGAARLRSNGGHHCKRFGKINFCHDFEA